MRHRLAMARAAWRGLAIGAGLVVSIWASPGPAQAPVPGPIAGPVPSPVLGHATLPPADDACAGDGALDYVCGPVKPEDLLALPGDEWVISSGFAPGAGLKLIDARTRTVRPWYRGTADQHQPDRASYPQCPGPLDPALFNARGLSLHAMARSGGKDRWQLLVVNHGGREAIEVFEIRPASAATSATITAPPELVWRGCLPMPAGQVGNAVASFADGTVLVSVLTRPGTSIADFVQGRITGAIWQWQPGDTTFTEIAGTQLPGNNGLETDPDGRHFYVVAFGWHAVVVFDRTDPARPVARIEAADFMPDNIHWSHGQLLLAGMRLDEPACGGLRPVRDGVADPMLCHRGWAVGAVDLVNRRIASVAYGTPSATFNGLSSAAWVGKELWLGSFQAERLAISRTAATR